MEHHEDDAQLQACQLLTQSVGHLLSLAMATRLAGVRVGQESPVGRNREGRTSSPSKLKKDVASPKPAANKKAQGGSAFKAKGQKVKKVPKRLFTVEEGANVRHCHFPKSASNNEHALHHGKILRATPNVRSTQTSQPNATISVSLHVLLLVTLRVDALESENAYSSLACLPTIRRPQAVKLFFGTCVQRIDCNEVGVGRTCGELSYSPRR